MMSEVDCRKLLKLVENRPAIYNYKLKEYKNRIFVQRLWNEIAFEMQLTSGECKWKWGNLRKAYTRFIRDNLAARGGTCWLSDCMEFVREYIFHTTSKGSLLDRNETEDPSSTKQPVRYSNVNYSAFYDDVTGKSNSTIMYPSSSLQMTTPGPFSNRDVVEERQADTTSKERTRVKSPVLNLNKPLEQRNKTEILESEKEHPIIVFVDSILPDIQKLSEKRKRKFKQDVLISLNNLIDNQDIDPYCQQI